MTESKLGSLNFQIFFKERNLNDFCYQRFEINQNKKVFSLILEEYKLPDIIELNEISESNWIDYLFEFASTQMPQPEFVFVIKKLILLQNWGPSYSILHRAQEKI